MIGQKSKHYRRRRSPSTGRCTSMGVGSCKGQEPTMTGMYPGKSHGQGPWVSHEKHRLDDSSSSNRRIRSCLMLLIGDGDYRGAKASAHKARATDCVLLVHDVSTPSPYILG